MISTDVSDLLISPPFDVIGLKINFSEISRLHRPTEKKHHTRLQVCAIKAEALHSEEGSSPVPGAFSSAAD